MICLPWDHRRGCLGRGGQQQQSCQGCHGQKAKSKRSSNGYGSLRHSMGSTSGFDFWGPSIFLLIGDFSFFLSELNNFYYVNLFSIIYMYVCMYVCITVYVYIIYICVHMYVYLNEWFCNILRPVLYARILRIWLHVEYHAYHAWVNLWI